MKKFLTRLFCVALCLSLLAGAAVAETKVTEEVDYAPVDEKTHEKNVDSWECPVLEDGTLGSGKFLGTESTVEDHVFVNGVCTLCEYESTIEVAPGVVKPNVIGKKDENTTDGSGANQNANASADDTTAGASADDAAEPTVHVVPASEVVHGVSVDQKLDAVKTLTAVVEALAEYDNVKLADAEKVFSADEAAKLSKLSAKDQVLVLLSALGYDVEETLSADAQSLLDEIKGRISAEDLLKAFPSEKITIDGQDVECYIVALSYDTADGSKVVERYAFRKDDGAFAQLTIEK